MNELTSDNEKSTKVVQLPASRRRINASRMAVGMTMAVLVAWILLCLLNDSLFLKEALVSSFIIGCSVLFNKSSLATGLLG